MCVSLESTEKVVQENNLYKCIMCINNQGAHIVVLHQRTQAGESPRSKTNSST